MECLPQGHADQAETLLKQLIDTSCMIFGSSSEFTLENMTTLALLYYDMKRYDDAEKLEFRILETQKVLLDREDVVTLSAMSNLAVTQLRLGKFEEAEGLLMEVLGVRKGGLGTGRRGLEAGNEEERDGNEDKYGDRDREVLKTLANLACLYETWGRHGEARKIMGVLRPTLLQGVGPKLGLTQPGD